MKPRDAVWLLPGSALLTTSCCNSKESYVESLKENLPYNPAGAGAVQAESTRCEAFVSSSDLRIARSPVYFGDTADQAHEDLRLRLVADCAKIKKAGFLGIQVDWGTKGQWKNKATFLEGEDGNPDCTIEPL
jgi:hypothetical protein